MGSIKRGGGEAPNAVLSENNTIGDCQDLLLWGTTTVCFWVDNLINQSLWPESSYISQSKPFKFSFAFSKISPSFIFLKYCSLPRMISI